MEEVIYSSKNFWAMMYKNFYGGHLPQSTCSYGWGSILMVLMLPLYLPGYLFYRITNINKLFLQDANFNFWVSFLLGWCGIVFGAGILKSFGIPPGDYGLLWLYLLYIFGIIIVAIVLGTLYGIIRVICGICSFFYKLYKVVFLENEIDTNGNEQTSVISDMYHSLKDKHCKKINWK